MELFTEYLNCDRLNYMDHEEGLCVLVVVNK